MLCAARLTVGQITRMGWANVAITDPGIVLRDAGAGTDEPTPRTAGNRAG
jgi:hypothetical protein